MTGCQFEGKTKLDRLISYTKYVLDIILTTEKLKLMYCHPLRERWSSRLRKRFAVNIGNKWILSFFYKECVQMCTNQLENHSSSSGEMMCVQA